MDGEKCRRTKSKYLGHFVGSFLLIQLVESYYSPTAVLKRNNQKKFSHFLFITKFDYPTLLKFPSKKRGCIVCLPRIPGETFNFSSMNENLNYAIKCF